MNKVQEFVQDAKEEIGRVSWLSRKQSLEYTVMVIIIGVLFTAVFAALDGGFSWLGKYIDSLI